MFECRLGVVEGGQGHWEGWESSLLGMRVSWTVLLLVATVWAEDLAGIDGRESGGGFVCAGEGFFMTGKQDGSFPAHGWHIGGAMGGLWTPTMRLLSGFDFRVADTYGATLYSSLSRPQFTQYPWGNEFAYPVSGRRTLVRSDMVVDRLGVSVGLSSQQDSPDSTLLVWQLFPHLRGPWLMEQAGQSDWPDRCWYEKHGVVVCTQVTPDGVSPTGYLAIGTNGGSLLAIELDSGSSSSQVEWLEEESEYHQQLSAYLKAQQPSQQGQLGNVIIRLCVEFTSSTSLHFSSGASHQEAVQNLEELMKEDFQTTKRAKIENAKRQRSRVDVRMSDSSLQEMYEWAKYNVGWLYQPIGTYGRGKKEYLFLKSFSSHSTYSAVMGGLPEYPMLYGCDTTYSIEGMLAIGMIEGQLDAFVILQSRC